ncbi:MAG: hypothetical protein MJ229_03940 [bacterium]|nr:hypothetical protein [bacterium]
MNYIFYFIIVFSIIFGATHHTLNDVVNAILDGSQKSIELVIALAGIMAFWLGIMKIAEKSGVVTFIAKLLKPITKRLFSDVPPEDEAIGDIAMNFTANALGLTNAATPMGLKAMQGLQKLNKDKEVASDAMCVFLGMNTASFQLVPISVIAILVGCGYNNPTEIILPTMIVTGFTFVSAIALALLFKKFYPSLNVAVEKDDRRFFEKIKFNNFNFKLDIAGIFKKIILKVKVILINIRNFVLDFLFEKTPYTNSDDKKSDSEGGNE